MAEISMGRVPEYYAGSWGDRVALVYGAVLLTCVSLPDALSAARMALRGWASRPAIW